MAVLKCPKCGVSSSIDVAGLEKRLIINSFMMGWASAVKHLMESPGARDMAAEEFYKEARAIAEQLVTKGKTVH